MADPENQLIELLPRRERARLLKACDAVHWTLGETVCEAGSPLLHAYFPVDGFVSIVVLADDKPGIEVGMIGREGMLGVSLALGVTSAPFRAVAQGSGSVRRIGAQALRAEFDVGGALHPLLLHYVNVSMVQMAASAACLRFHQIGHRLARWLLMSQDRAHADHFHVTHEFLAWMLGVRRVGVTLAAGALQRAHLITYHRGELRILDRAGLEHAACSCYKRDQVAYASLA